MKNSILLSLIAIAFFAGLLHAGLRDGKASLVLGQTGFTQNVEGNPASNATLNSPSFIAVDSKNNRLFVTDTSNSRVLFWNNMSSLANGQAADGVIGQQNFLANLTACTANGLNTPYGVCVDASSNLWVADSGNNRVLRFSGTPFTGMSADTVIGQPSFVLPTGGCSSGTLSSPYSVAIDTTGNLWVSDRNNNRVLRFDSPFSTVSATASFVMGQNDFNAFSPGLSAGNLNQPYGIAISPDGSVFVCDSHNNRVLVFSSTGAVRGQSAYLVLGQTSTVSGYVNGGNVSNPGIATLSNPSSVIAFSTGVWVADSDNYRILKYQTPLTSGASAVFLLGQPDFTHGLPPVSVSANSFNSPSCVTFDASGSAWVIDKLDYRVLKFSEFSLSGISPAVGLSGLFNKQVVISGAGIPAGSTITLQRSGQPPIPAAGISYDSEQSVSCSFNLTNASVGNWDVVATYADSLGNTTTRTLTAAFRVFNQNITSVSPTAVQSGDLITNFTATAQYGGFVYGTTLALMKTGQASIFASAITMSADETRISGTFDLTGAATGFWNVYVATGTINTTASEALFISTSAVTQRSIDPNIENFISIQGASYGVLLDISTGTFADYVKLTVAIPDITPQISQTELKPLFAFFDISDDKGLQPGTGITMTVSYSNSIVAGLDKSKFRVCLYDPGLNRWAPVPSTAYPAANKIVATISHFSRYGVFQLVPATRLGNIYVYPNPYRPDSNTIYDNPALGRGIVFAGLPPSAQVKIFTISGEFVKEIDISNGDGTLLWDTQNADGLKCSSGVYIYLVTSPNDPGKKSTGKFAIAE